MVLYIFEKQKSAELAIQKVNGMLINNKKVFVGLHLKRQERKDGGNVDIFFTNVYINNLPKSFDNKDLYELFEEYGEIISAKIEKEEKIEKVESEEKTVLVSKGFGFVCFNTTESAKKAVDGMKDKEIEGKNLRW